MTERAQLHARGLTIEQGGRPLIEDGAVTIAPGDRIGLVGPNGAGKSTLLGALAGRHRPVAGRVETTPAEATVGLLAQELLAGDGVTIADHLAAITGLAAASAALDRATDDLAAATPEAADAYQAALDAWLALGGADWDRRLPEALAEIGLALDGAGATHLAPTTPVAGLSGGQRARLGLAALALARHDLLLLDEPTNDLDLDGLEILERFVAGWRGGMLIVSHDRRFLERTVTSVLELDPYTRTLTRYDEPYLGYLAAKEITRSHAQHRYDTYDRQRAQLRERSQQQRRWATTGVSREKRQSRDNDKVQRDFRVNRTEKLASKARQTERALERLDVVDKPWEPWELRFTIGAVERSGDLVAELQDATVERGRFRLGPITLTVTSGERVAVAGVNGAGKTTLLAALLGDLDLAGGRHRLGSGTVIGRLEQARRQLGGAGTAVEHLVDTTGLPPAEARSVLAKFGLGADHLTRPVASLSAGERTRAVLARFQAAGVNTLVLDEPTNHLDLPAIEQLEQALGSFAGTLLLVTHDRAFLDAVDLTRVVTIDGGRVAADELV